MHLQWRECPVQQYNVKINAGKKAGRLFMANDDEGKSEATRQSNIMRTLGSKALDPLALNVPTSWQKAM